MLQERYAGATRRVKALFGSCHPQSAKNDGEAVPYLLIEDSGTRGLTGDPRADPELDHPGEERKNLPALHPPPSERAAAPPPTRPPARRLHLRPRLPPRSHHEQGPHRSDRSPLLGHQTPPPQTRRHHPHRPGNLRRLIAVIQQLDFNYDLYGMRAGEILQLLPPEFDAWRPPPLLTRGEARESASLPAS